MIAALLSQTGLLAGGFAINIAITVMAMVLGTALGAVLGLVRYTGGVAARIAGLLTGLCRNLPSFVLLFYLAFMLPVEFEWDGAFYLFPVWVKAAVALTIPVIGFASDRFLEFRRQLAEGEAGADLVFLAAWVQYALFILMASPTASVIGTDEILARANRIAAQDPDPGFLMLTYGYTSLWFLLAGLALTALAGWIERRSGRSRDRVLRANRRRRRRQHPGHASQKAGTMTLDPGAK